MEMKYVNVFFMEKVLMEKMMLIVLLVFLEVIIIFMIMFGFRNENENIVSAFEVEKLVEKSGYRNIFENNVLYMDRPYGEIDIEKRIYVDDRIGEKFSVKRI